MRRTKEEAEKTRVAILASAELLFLERGVAHTSLDQIARHAGVTRGAVYWHFQNKAHLFHEMLCQVRLPPEQMAERLSSQQGAGSLQVLWEMCLEALLLICHDERKRRIFTILLHRCEFTEELREAEERHHEFIQQFLHLCEQLIIKAQHPLQGSLSPRTATMAIHSMLVGMMTNLTSVGYSPCSDNDLEQVVDSAFRGVFLNWKAPQRTLQI